MSTPILNTSNVPVITCVRHPEREADFHCQHCEEGYCRECVTRRVYSGAVINLCSICHNPVVDLAPTLPLEPFWRRPLHFLAFPFSGDGGVLFLGWPIVAMLLRIAAEPALTEPGFAMFAAQPVLLYGLYFSLLAAVFSKLVARGEQGKLDMPSAGVFEGFLESFFKPIWNFLGAVMSAFWPLFVLPLALWIVFGRDPFEVYDSMKHYLALALSAGLGVGGMFLLPMALLVMAVTQNLAVVQNPVFLLKEADKVRREYGIVLLWFWGAVAIYAGVHHLMVIYLLKGSGWLYLLHHALDAELHLYLFLHLGHLLGYLAYQTRFKLHWWPDTRVEPFLWVRGHKLKLSWRYEPPPENREPRTAARPLSLSDTEQYGAPPPAPTKLFDLKLHEELRDRVQEASYLADHGNYEGGRAIFREVLDRAPDHFEALRGMVMCSFRLDDYDTVKAYAGRVAEELAKEYAWESLWDMHQDYQRTLPDFSLPAAALHGLAEWLEERELYLDAARVRRELAGSYPDDPVAPAALWRCGELLRDCCDKAAIARSVFEALVKRYPDSMEADRAREALAPKSDDKTPGPN